MEQTKKNTLLLSIILLCGAVLLRWPDLFGLCAQVGSNWVGGVGCYLNVFNETGIPAFAFAEIIITAIILWFSSIATRRRWNRFAVMFASVSALLLLLARPYERGLLGIEPVRSEVAAWLSLAFGVITFIIICVSALVNRRKKIQ